MKEDGPDHHVVAAHSCGALTDRLPHQRNHRSRHAPPRSQGSAATGCRSWPAQTARPLPQSAPDSAERQSTLRKPDALGQSLAKEGTHGTVRKDFQPGQKHLGQARSKHRSTSPGPPNPGDAPRCRSQAGRVCRPRPGSTRKPVRQGHTFAAIVDSRLGPPFTQTTMARVGRSRPRARRDLVFQRVLGRALGVDPKLKAGGCTFLPRIRLERRAAQTEKLKDVETGGARREHPKANPPKRP